MISRATCRPSCLLCVAIALSNSAPAFAANFWLSTTSDPAVGSAPPATPGVVPQISHLVGTPTGSIFIWARPDPGKTLANWSLHLISTNPNVLSFTGSSVEAFNVLDELDPNTVRWEQVAEPSGNSTSILDLKGFSLYGYGGPRFGIGIGPQSTGSPFDDPLYDPNNDGWLLAQIDYSLTGVLEQTDLYLQIGSDGLNNFTSTPEDPNNFLEASSLTSAVLGALTDNALNASTQRQVNSATRDASISVVAALDNANFNGDNYIDGRDFLIWQQNAGDPGSHATGDANNDGQVNGADRMIWELQYGSPPPLSTLHVVPEPTGLSLILVACLSLTQRRGFR